MLPRDLTCIVQSNPVRRTRCPSMPSSLQAESIGMFLGKSFTRPCNGSGIKVGHGQPPRSLELSNPSAVSYWGGVLLVNQRCEAFSGSSVVMAIPGNENLPWGRGNLKKDHPALRRLMHMNVTKRHIRVAPCEICNFKTIETVLIRPIWLACRLLFSGFVINSKHEPRLSLFHRWLASLEQAGKILTNVKGGN